MKARSRQQGNTTIYKDGGKMLHRQQAIFEETFEKTKVRKIFVRADIFWATGNA